MSPVSGLTAGIEIVKRIQKQGCSPSGKVFLEIGTGRVPLVPLAYWLMGAEKTITIDLNPYLKIELIRESLHFACQNKEYLLSLFGPLVDKEKLEALLRFCRDAQFSLSEFLGLCRINYIAPGNAARTYLYDQSIDFHTSYTVFEHVPLETLKQILEEGNRVITKNGLFIHRIDYSDHFSHSDRRISAINFLQYSDDEWQRYAGNRYMFMNRLRHDDFISVFESVGHRILETQPDIDERSLDLLRSGAIKINYRFASKSKDILATTGAWIVSRKND